MVLLTLSFTMSGIMNLGQNCFLNALMQCMSVNQTLINALQIHSRTHEQQGGKFI